MSPVLVCRSISQRFGPRDVLVNIDLTLSPGEVLVVRGPSGVGKSTLLRIAAGLTPPTRGSVSMHATRVGVVFQEPRLLPWRTALDNVALPLVACGCPGKEARDKARRMLHRMELNGFSTAHPHELSGGMRQRVSLARALAIEPELLFLDEPFTGLDPKLRQTMLRHLEQYLDQSGAATMHVTHDLVEIPSTATRVLHLTPRGPEFEPAPRHRATNHTHSQPEE
ncbi:ATP-binding cassette domain-containing protein [Oceanidesulfovibrio marinus]|uniref:ABC transporter ATP-binding protein n=1 Tax=Oceanidesulfovibrio marinus TaxID=370038 RepID=UPI001ABEFAF9